jgi:lysophospholipase L1-like esterase
MFRSHLFVRVATAFALALLLLFASIPAFAQSRMSLPRYSLVGPKEHYLVLGDSMAFGFQPDLNFAHGYADDFGNDLMKTHGVHDMANLACPGETSSTMLNGTCPYPFFRKYPYIGSQMAAALKYLAAHRGQVSPVTFNIGSNDLLSVFNEQNCTVNVSLLKTGLQTLDTNLTHTILPELHDALMVNGELTGDLIMVNYYDPFQNMCPNTVPYVQMVDAHLAHDIAPYGTMVDVFSAFGGAKTPDPNTCTYTWICSVFHDIHATDTGYRVIANTIEATVGY